MVGDDHRLAVLTHSLRLLLRVVMLSRLDRDFINGMFSLPRLTSTRLYCCGYSSSNPYRDNTPAKIGFIG